MVDNQPQHANHTSGADAPARSAPTASAGAGAGAGDTVALAGTTNGTVSPTLTMAGFDEFTDIVHYIKDSTYRIWDKKNIGLIYRFYTPTTVVHTSDGDTYGRDQVIANSLTKMAGFPDIRDFIDEVIWAGNDRDGYRTSMRWTWTARNTGWSVYGPPTGKKVRVTGLANCIVRGEHIIEEWVVYNELSLIRQLGLDPREVMARQLAAAPTSAAPAVFGEVDRLDGQGPPPERPAPVSRGSGFDVEDFVHRSTHDIWNRRMFGLVDRCYAPNYLCHGASDRELYGTGDLKEDILARVAAFPDAAVHIDDLYWLDDGDGRYRTAVLWTLVGTHTGPSHYGPPTGRRVRLLGITQHRIEGGRFVEEWSEFSEFNLMKQLYTPIPPATEGAAWR